MFYHTINNLLNANVKITPRQKSNSWIAMIAMLMLGIFATIFAPHYVGEDQIDIVLTTIKYLMVLVITPIIVIALA